MSPLLLNARNLELAVPGTYSPEREEAGDLVTISYFSPSIDVRMIRRSGVWTVFVSDNSEQTEAAYNSYEGIRWTKLQVRAKGGRGKLLVNLIRFYLLKGHEDLKQDERVMQLFGLINSLVAGQASKSRKFGDTASGEKIFAVRIRAYLSSIRFSRWHIECWICDVPAGL